MSRVSAEVTLCELRTTPLSVDEVLDSVRAPGAGAVCVFIGTIRNVDEDKTVAVTGYRSARIGPVPQVRPVASFTACFSRSPLSTGSAASRSGKLPS